MAEAAGKGKARKRGGAGVLTTVGGALVLVTLGFGLGLLAGAAYEEPALVAEHLAGRSELVPLAEGLGLELPADPAEPKVPTLVGPSDVSPAPETAAARRPAPASAAAPPSRRPLGARQPPDPSPPAVAAAPPIRGGFSIQVGAFGEAAGARKLRDELRGAGFTTEVVEIGGGAPFKVRVGPVATRAEADRLASALKSRHQLPTWVVAR